jgi:hypothetical protein
MACREAGALGRATDLGYSEKLIILAVLRVTCYVTGHLTNYVARITLAVSLFLLNSLSNFRDMSLSAMRYQQKEPLCYL